MSRMLFGDVASKLRREWKGKRLAIVASGALEYAPFAVLPLPETEGRREGEDGRRGDGATGRRGDRATEKPHLAPSPRRPVAPRPSPLLITKSSSAISFCARPHPPRNRRAAGDPEDAGRPGRSSLRRR